MFYVHYGFRIESERSRDEDGEEAEVEKMRNLNAMQGLRTYRPVYFKPGCYLKSPRSFYYINI